MQAQPEKSLTRVRGKEFEWSYGYPPPKTLPSGLVLLHLIKWLTALQVYYKLLVKIERAISVDISSGSSRGLGVKFKKENRKRRHDSPNTHMPAYSKQNYSGRGKLNTSISRCLGIVSHLEHVCVNEKKVSFRQRCRNRIQLLNLLGTHPKRTSKKQAYCATRSLIVPRGRPRVL